MGRRGSLLLAPIALALGGAAILTQAPTPTSGEAVAVATAQQDGTAAPRRSSAPAPTSLQRNLMRILALTPSVSAYGERREPIWLGRVRDSLGRPMGSRFGQRGAR